MKQKFQNQLNLNLGFTLVEVLVVMAILGILITIGFGNFMSSKVKSRDAQRKADLKHITQALEVYYNDKGAYPIDNGSSSIDEATWGDDFVDPDNASTIYMPVVPFDPTSAQHYCYYSDGTYYQIYARLENTQDADVPKNPGTEVPRVYQDTDCGADTCNFGLSSSNITPENYGHTAVDE